MLMDDNQMSLSCFMAYDIRGKVPDELNEALAYRIGHAYVVQIDAKQVVIGYDVRLESISIANALKKGITDAGADVLDIGLCGTEEVYFATFNHKTDGGIMVTASHNPKGYNGMKLVQHDARPISGDSGLNDIKQLVLENNFSNADDPGTLITNSDKSAYLDHLLTYLSLKNLKPLKIVMDPGNGSAGAVIRKLAARLPFDCIFINETPDGHFPNGVPNPLLPENRAITSAAVKSHRADLGIAWDGDFDRCFLFDENGEFIEGYYLVGLLAETLLDKNPNEKIIHDPRLTWNTIEQVTEANGIAIQSKTGHAFIKERMRAENALYGGEMSAHHYFRDFAYCDSGMIPWLLIVELISKSNTTLSQLVKNRMAAFPCSGEINYKVSDPQAVIDRVISHFDNTKTIIDRTDGVSIEFSDWRMNIRSSNTEPLLRLNIETRGNKVLVKTKLSEVEKLINTYP